MLPELAALAASAVRHLVWPPLQHVPGQRQLGAALADVMPYKKKGGEGAGAGAGGQGTLVVQVVHIHDTLAIPPRSVKLDVLQAELDAALYGSAVRVEVRESYLSFSMCDLCVSAYSSALRVRTRRQEGSSVTAAAGQVLDRLVLHRSMREYDEVVLAYSGVHDTSGVLPVFVFDLSLREEALLLDGELQAAAFPDMVLAVASLAPPARTRTSCGHMSRNLQPEDVTRGVLGAVLQSAFALPHTAQRYHPSSGAGWDYLWTLGATPFAPLSAATQLSRPLAAAAVRNLALAEAERQAGRVAAVLRGLLHLAPGKHGGGGGDWRAALPSAPQRQRLAARVNVAALKLGMAAAALGQGRNADALRIALQMSPDAAAIEHVAAQLQSTLLAKLDCSAAPLVTHGSASSRFISHWLLPYMPYIGLLWPPLGSLALWVAAGWWRGRWARKRADARYDKIY
ncbi:hypothetical protein Agub_g11530 [Astrephomene gubernaculifera]|uniref:Uncharacterized protein n=1 Tax=Astrephomene gubernaculifera TaxID=47775 RepID=A0AAD3DWN9_9CHLO|nr:hypothetical protein Agub_g11530 [Astrephomene gubernaculifera]